jgi:hypothetical protein
MVARELANALVEKKSAPRELVTKDIAEGYGLLIVEQRSIPPARNGGR